MVGGPRISTRIEHRHKSKAKGQRRHDMREGPMPKYVDPERIDQNSVLREPLKEAALAEICEQRAARQPRKRARKSTAAIATTGIVTFSKEAQPIVNELSVEEQDKLLIESAKEIADAMGTTLTGAVVHRDETALHLHFQCPSVRTDGRPVSKVVDTSFLQDAAAKPWSHLGIHRGTPKQTWKDMAEPWYKHTHRSVKRLHADLPWEIQQAEERAAAAEQQAAEAEQRAAEAETKAAEAVALVEAEAAEKIAELTAKVERQERLLSKATEKRKRLEKDNDAKEADLKTMTARERTKQRRLDKMQKEIAELRKQVAAPKPKAIEQTIKPARRRLLIFQTPAETRRVLAYPAQSVRNLMRDATAKQQEAIRGEELAQEDRARMADLQRQSLEPWSAVAPKPSRSHVAIEDVSGPFRRRYGVMLTESPQRVVAPPQDATPRQIATALYSAGREAGWKQAAFDVRDDVADEIIKLAAEDGRLDSIEFTRSGLRQQQNGRIDDEKDRQAEAEEKARERAQEAVRPVRRPSKGQDQGMSM